MKNQWIVTNFYENESDDKPLMRKLADYLNENNVDDFKIIAQEERYIEIAYKLSPKP